MVLRLYHTLNVYGEVQSTNYCQGSSTMTTILMYMLTTFNQYELCTVTLINVYMNDEDPSLGGVGTSCTTSRKYMFGLGLGQKKIKCLLHLF